MQNISRLRRYRISFRFYFLFSALITEMNVRLVCLAQLQSLRHCYQKIHTEDSLVHGTSGSCSTTTRRWWHTIAWCYYCGSLV